eukprot:scaffold7684_cov888-Pinguiococcus_pyrenoidosus.AAC.1
MEEVSMTLTTGMEDILTEFRQVQEWLAEHLEEHPEALSGNKLAQQDVVDFGALLERAHAAAMVMYKDIYRHQLMMPLRRFALARRHILKIPTQL